MTPHFSPPPPSALVEFLGGLERVLITTHANPDGDAIGSESGLARAFHSLGTTTMIWNRDPAPGAYADLIGALPHHIGASPPKDFPESYDAVFFVECPTVARSGHIDVFADLTKINVDHHLGNSLYGLHNWVLPNLASVSIMIFQIAVALGATLDQTALDSLLLGLATDTGGFRFSNTSADAHRAAAAMVEAGASPERVSKTLFESRSEASVRLLGEVLTSLQRSADGAVATVLITQQMLDRAGAAHQDGESLVDYPRSISGVEIAALLREIGPDHFKASLRSRGDVSVESVARRHGGGGHRNAAGCELHGDIESLRASLVEELHQALRQAGKTS